MKYNFSRLYFVAIYIFLSASIWGADTGNTGDEIKKNQRVNNPNVRNYGIYGDIASRQEQACALTGRDLRGRLDSILMRTGPELVHILNINVMERYPEKGFNPLTGRLFLPFEKERIEKYKEASLRAHKFHIREPKDEDVIDLAKQYFNNALNPDGEIFFERWFDFNHTDQLFKEYEASDVSLGKLNWYLGSLANRPADKKKAINYRELTYRVYDEAGQAKVNTILITQVHGTGYFRGNDGIEQKEYSGWNWQEYGHSTLLAVLSYLKKEGLHPSPFQIPSQILNPHPVFARDSGQAGKRLETDRKRNYIEAQKAFEFYGVNDFNDENIFELLKEYVNDNPSITQEGKDVLTEKLRFPHLDLLFAGNKRSDLDTAKIKWFFLKTDQPDGFNSDGKFVSSRIFYFLIHDEKGNLNLVNSKYRIFKGYVIHVAGMGFMAMDALPMDTKKYLDWGWDKHGQASLLSLFQSTHKKGLRFLSLEPKPQEHPSFFSLRNSEAYERHLSKTLKKTIASEPEYKIEGEIKLDEIIVIWIEPIFPKKIDRQATLVPKHGIYKAYHIEDAYDDYILFVEKNHPNTAIQVKNYERERVKFFGKYLKLKRRGQVELDPIKSDEEVRKLWQEYLSNPQKFNPDAPGISEEQKREALRKRTILNVKIDSNSDLILFELTPDSSGGYLNSAINKIKDEKIGTWVLRPSSRRDRRNVSYLTLTYRSAKGVEHEIITKPRGFAFVITLNNGYRYFSSIIEMIEFLKKNFSLTDHVK